MTPRPVELGISESLAEPVRSEVATGLAWGVRSSFRRYVERIAHGSCTTDGGAGSLPDGRFYFPVASSTGVDPDVLDGTIRFHGGVRFVGHLGAIELRLGELELRIESGRGALLTSSQAGVRDLMELRATEVRSDDKVVAITLASRLVEGAEELFGEVYAAATPFDDLEVRIPLAIPRATRKSLALS